MTAPALALGSASLAMSWAWVQYRAWPPEGGQLVPGWWVAMLGGLLIIGPGALYHGGAVADVAAWAWLVVGLLGWAVAYRVDVARLAMLRRADLGDQVRRALRDGDTPSPAEETDPPGVRAALEAAAAMQADRRTVRIIRDHPCLVTRIEGDGTIVHQAGGGLRDLGMRDVGWTGLELEAGSVIREKIQPRVLAGERVAYRLQWGGRQYVGLGAPWYVATRGGLEIQGALYVALDVTGTGEEIRWTLPPPEVP